MPPRKDSPDSGNTQVDGSAIHKNPVSEAKADLRAAEEMLRQIEAKNIPGAASRTPKSLMLDAGDVEAANPDYHYRFVSLRDPNRLQARLLEGYEIVPKEEGGRRLGDELALARVPRQVYEARVEREKQAAKERLEASQAEYDRLAESIARTLRDQHGLNIDPRRLLVREDR